MLHSMLRQKKPWWPYWVLFGIIGFTIDQVMTYFRVWYLNTSQMDLFLVGRPIYFLIMFSGLWYITGETLWKISLVFLISDICGGLPFVMSFAIVKGEQILLETAVGILFFGIEYLCLHKLLKKIKASAMNPMNIVLKMLVIFYYSYLVLNIFDNYKFIDRDKLSMMVLVSMLLALCGFFTYVNVERKQRNQYLILQKESMEEHLEALGRQKELADQFSQEIMACINKMEDAIKKNPERDSQKKEELQECRKLLLEQKATFKREQYSHLEFLDLLLKNEMERCKENGIEMSIDIQELKFSEMNLTDLVSVFANLIDNAIESCLKVPKHQKRYIRVSGEKGDTGSVLEVENAKIREMILRAGKRTSKKNKSEHGLGLSIVKEIVEKHGGEIQVKEEEERFLVIVHM